MTIILDNYPPHTHQGVGLGGRKNPRIITRSRPQSELQVINFFVCREECGEVFGSFGGDKFEAIFSWENMKEKLPLKIHWVFHMGEGGCKNPKFHHLDLLVSPSLKNYCRRELLSFRHLL